LKIRVSRGILLGRRRTGVKSRLALQKKNFSGTFSKAPGNRGKKGRGEGYMWEAGQIYVEKES